VWCNTIFLTSSGSSAEPRLVSPKAWLLSAQVCFSYLRCYPITTRRATENVAALLLLDPHSHVDSATAYAVRA
jgi:hypothetical protein